MTPALAIQLGLLILPKLQTGILQFVAWINANRTAMQQSGEWTIEHEAAWKEALLAKNLRPEEIPDANLMPR